MSKNSKNVERIIIIDQMECLPSGEVYEYGTVQVEFEDKTKSDIICLNKTMAKYDFIDIFQHVFIVGNQIQVGGIMMNAKMLGAL